MAWLRVRPGFRQLTGDPRFEAIARRVGAIIERGDTTLDLLLTDVVMPGSSGIKLAADLRGWLPKLKVLYMSGYAGGAVAREGLAGAGVAYLEKPFTPNSLVEKVNAILNTEE